MEILTIKLTTVRNDNVRRIKVYHLRFGHCLDLYKMVINIITYKLEKIQPLGPFELFFILYIYIVIFLTFR